MKDDVILYICEVKSAETAIGSGYRDIEMKVLTILYGISAPEERRKARATEIGDTRLI